MRRTTGTLGWMAAMLVATAVFFSALAPARAQWKASPFGIGLRVGDPTTLSMKYWLDTKSALQLDFGWVAAYRRPGTGFYYPGPFFSADWVFQIANFAPRSPAVWFGIHVGAGGSFGFVGDSCYVDTFGYTYCGNSVVARMPFGFNVYIRKVHIEAVAELVPGLRIAPRVGPTFSASVAGRYYF